MRSSEYDAISGFLRLLNYHCHEELLLSLNDKEGCLSFTIVPEELGLPENEIHVDLSWNGTWLSLGTCISASWLTPKALQSLLLESVSHLQCATDNSGRVHILSKFRRAEVRQEQLYQKFVQILEKLRVAKVSG
ncbi:hypothetical protein GCM10007938_35820 [Vibrio zhanjiangensis]|uniref:Uncharacterized protein n=1 Tax=Vibrio zhanjiangensis TaxID=1046128 RepID=A0ABQ6F3H5_9VIBR|nr:hypothetical protein [Vibrio zhanjiangensis]GLT19799.1 hypothetical protein GCM10007938_35820 [Vibrio zhanjiangensis]